MKFKIINEIKNQFPIIVFDGENKKQQPPPSQTDELTCIVVQRIKKRNVECNKHVICFIVFGFK